jgi:hypothetical protein
MLAAELAVLPPLKPVRVLLLVLCCVIIALLAFGAGKRNFNTRVISHFFGTSDTLNLTAGGGRCTSLSAALRPSPWRPVSFAQQKNSARRGRVIISPHSRLVNIFF